MNIVAATTSNKLDTLASFLTCAVSDISYLITEKDPFDSILQPYAAQGITIL
jgi:DeoR/GlpR family transcriptional regulator of sugar metabolism